MDMSNLITTIYYAVPFDHVCFVVHFDYFIKKTCLSVCGETTIYIMGDVLLEREFN